MLVVSELDEDDFDEDEYEDLDVKIAEFTAVSVVVEVTPLLLIVLFFEETEYKYSTYIN